MPIEKNKKTKLNETIASPAKVLKMAIYGMLPKNKLREKIIKKLKIEN